MRTIHLLILLVFLCSLITVGSSAVAHHQAQEAYWIQYFDPLGDDYWYNFPKPRVSSYFTREQRLVIWEALEKAQQSLKSYDVLTCVDRNTTYEHYTDETPSEAIQRLTNSNAILYINSSSDENILGRARLGKSRKIRKFKIKLSAPNLSSSDFDSNHFAGTIVHEMLHQASYDHPEFPENSRHYYRTFRGNLVYETAWCLRSLGQEDLYALESGQIRSEGLQGNGSSHKTRRWLPE